MGSCLVNALGAVSAMSENVSPEIAAATRFLVGAVGIERVVPLLSPADGARVRNSVVSLGGSMDARGSTNDALLDLLEALGGQVGISVDRRPLTSVGLASLLGNSLDAVFGAADVAEQVTVIQKLINELLTEIKEHGPSRFIQNQLGRLGDQGALVVAKVVDASVWRELAERVDSTQPRRLGLWLQRPWSWLSETG